MPAVLTGAVEFGDLEYRRQVSAPPNDMSDFDNPIATAFPFGLEGPRWRVRTVKRRADPLGGHRRDDERGMILEVDLLSQRSYLRAFELLMQNDYPAAGTHGSTGCCTRWGRLKTGMLSRRPTGSTLQGSRSDLKIEADTPPRASASTSMGCRHGAALTQRCGSAQEDPVTYPLRRSPGT